jgi:hypothetical protein
MTADPRDLEALAAYVDGTLDKAPAAELEDPLFAAAAEGDAPTAVFLDRIARDGAHLVAHATFHMGITRGQLAALQARSDVEVQVVDLGTPGKRDVSARRSGDFFATILRVGLRDCERVDIETEIPHAGVRKTIRDVLVDPDDGNIYGLCERDLALLGLSAGHAISRVITERDGKREIIAIYDVTSRIE